VLLASATPSLWAFWTWRFEIPLLLVVLTVVLYWVGCRRTYTPERSRGAQVRRSACFYTAMAVAFFALCPPFHWYADRLFWVHMIQHVLLMMVAAPLVVLSRPWIRLFRVLPLGSRRTLARAFSDKGHLGPLSSVGHWLGTPPVSLALFAIVLLGWHVPVLFNATLTSSLLHALEHTMFIAVAIMFWKQVIPSPPLKIVLGQWGRVMYITAAMAVSWALSLWLALSTHPLYAHYAQLSSRPGGISAMTDQQLAAGVMWVPGSVTFVIVLLVYFVGWLAPSSDSGPGQALAGEH